MLAPINRMLPWDGATTWAAMAAAIVFLAIGARAVIAPSGAAGFFGVPVEGGAGLVFVQAFGARNIAMALTAIALVCLDQRNGLACLLLAAALVAAIDASAVGAQAGMAAAAKHIGYVIALSGFGAWLISRGWK